MIEKFNNMNKRGDVTITILVIGVFVLCTATILSFYFSATIVRDASVGLDLMEQMNSNLDRADSTQINWNQFAKNPNEILKIVPPETKECYYLEKEKGGKTLFSVKVCELRVSHRK